MRLIADYLKPMARLPYRRRDRSELHPDTTAANCQTVVLRLAELSKQRKTMRAGRNYNNPEAILAFHTLRF
jgi:hypothetical protein